MCRRVHWWNVLDVYWLVLPEYLPENWSNSSETIVPGVQIRQNVLQLFRITRGPVMSKTSLDFGLFCDVNQNLKARHFLADYLGNGILLHRVQNVMVYDLWSVDFDLFSVFSVFVRGSVFSRFCSQVFLPSYWKMTIETLNTEEAQIWEGENEPVRSRQHLIFQVCSLLPPLFDKDWMLW